MSEQKGAANALADIAVWLMCIAGGFMLVDRARLDETRVDGDILDVRAESNIIQGTTFSVTLDLDDGRVIVCPVQSDMYGGTLYRLYRNRKPDLPRLRETARVQVGRHSGSVVCRGLAMADAESGQ